MARRHRARNPEIPGSLQIDAIEAGKPTRQFA